MIESFKKHALACYPQEACGYFLDNAFYPLENLHPDPTNNFLLSEDASFKLADLEGYTIVHTHTFDRYVDDPRTPSLEDMKSQKATDVQWGIAHCDGENVSEIIYFGKPSKENLIGRSYISNIFDCFTIARDFYFQEFNIDLGTHPRPAKWEEWNPHYIEHTYSSLGFKELPQNEKILHGDILLFAIASNYINHIGVVIDKDTFIHHLHNRKSCIDTKSRWGRQLRKVLRRSSGS